MLRYIPDNSIQLTSDQTAQFGAVIIGAGLAGLYCALNLPEDMAVAVIAKESIDISNSYFAQGGIAAAIAPTDAPVFHVEDTLTAGAGLCDRRAVEVLCAEGPGDIRDLVSRGVPFDLDEVGELAITREGGHHQNRIVHSGGDATGRKTVDALLHLLSQRRNISFFENTCFFDVLTDKKGVTGALIRGENGDFRVFSTSALIIATGGIGQVYMNSTNPEVATGDGLAAALRAGAVLENLEFVQFHPTGLFRGSDEQTAGGQAFLVSEAVRGEGGKLVNKAGVRFMESQHELAELAPRDIVARCIFAEMQNSGEPNVFLDVSSISKERFAERFPTIFAEVERLGLNLPEDKIPVCPVQHYSMGGIKTDIDARTSISGLYAIGEAASTGVHGANRLASNSMLECLVFGRRAAEDITKNRARSGGVSLPDLGRRQSAPPDFSEKLDNTRTELRRLMTEYGYVVRRASEMTAALARIQEMKEELTPVYSADYPVKYMETLNLLTVAEVILTCAIARKQSIGAHYIVG
jgi:L-aspartate oxidase